jgi:16S rRNA (uracil1498-N3)-methyltransferase
MHRFFLDPQNFTPTDVHFDEATARQIAQVLRLRPGDTVTCLDNRGGAWLVELADVTAKACLGKIKQPVTLDSEPMAQVTLYLCLAQREKFEWMLQKCTEVGAAAFVPVISSRSLVQEKQGVEQKRERWEAILKEAAEQSGRGRIPRLEAALNFKEALAALHTHDLALAAWEEEHSIGLRTLLRGRPLHSVALLIGPEGGFSSEEMEAARAAGAVPISLGRRILRMETAAVVATALVLHELGEMDV